MQGAQGNAAGQAAPLGTRGRGTDRVGSHLQHSALWTPQPRRSCSYRRCLAGTCNIFLFLRMLWSCLEQAQVWCRSSEPGPILRLTSIGTECLPSGERRGDHQAHRPLGKCISLFNECIPLDNKMSCGGKWDFPLEVLLLLLPGLKPSLLAVL